MSRRRAWTIAAVVAAVVAAAVTAAAVWSLTRSPDPAQAAAGFVAALESGDGAAAVGALADAAAHPGLADAFAAAEAHVTDAHVTAVDVEDDRARAAATATLDGRAVDVGFSLERRDGRWLVADDALRTVTVTTSIGTSIGIGGTVLPAGALSLLPAQYRVTAAPGTLLSGAVVIDVPADDGAAASASVPAALTAEARTRAQEQIDAYADACTQTAGRVPEACALHIPWQADLREARSFAYRVERRPVVTVSDDGRTFEAVNGSVVVTVSGVARDGRETSATYRNDAWALRGDVTVDDTGMTLSVR